MRKELDYPHPIANSVFSPSPQSSENLYTQRCAVTPFYSLASTQAALVAQI